MSQQEYHVYTRHYAEELSQRINKMCSEEKLSLNYKENLCGNTLSLTFSLPEPHTSRHSHTGIHTEPHADPHTEPHTGRHSHPGHPGHPGHLGHLGHPGRLSHPDDTDHNSHLGKSREESILCRIQKYYFIQALIDVIQECWEKPQVYSRLKKTFEWTDEEILQNGESILQRLNCSERGHKNLRGKFLARELIAYFEEQKSLDIEGYLDFRGKTYHNVLARQVDSAVAELQMEEEEKSSLELMRNILQRRPEKFAVLHVNLVSSDTINLWSSQGRLLSVSAEGEPCEIDIPDIPSQAAIGVKGEPCEMDIPLLKDPNPLRYHNPADCPIEDVLIPVLYFFGPREIVLHSCHRLPHASSDILAVMGVLQNVFDEAFRLCPGCEKCT
ncbi:MAG: putative sporulation protein YtxC [Peptococcaceae bacterium]|nr:putative sporulation protein YtxC [Peptococcaceae bacterium]